MYFCKIEEGGGGVDGNREEDKNPCLSRLRMPLVFSTHEHGERVFLLVLFRRFSVRCSRDPIVLSVHDHGGRGLLLALSIIIPVCCAMAPLVISTRKHKNGVLFSSSREELPFVVIARACSYLHLQARKTGNIPNKTKIRPRLTCLREEKLEVRARTKNGNVF